jgi:hypothetical protein
VEGRDEEAADGSVKHVRFKVTVRKDTEVQIGDFVREEIPTRYTRESLMRMIGAQTFIEEWFTWAHPTLPRLEGWEDRLARYVELHLRLGQELSAIIKEWTITIQVTSSQAGSCPSRRAWGCALNQEIFFKDSFSVRALAKLKRTNQSLYIVALVQAVEGEYARVIIKKKDDVVEVYGHGDGFGEMAAWLRDEFNFAVEGAVLLPRFGSIVIAAWLEPH